MGPNVEADPAAAARLRGQRPRALERPVGAVPSARGPGEHPDRQLHDCGAVLPPPAPAGPRPERAAADRDDAERPPAAQAGSLDAAGAVQRLLPPGDPGSRCLTRDDPATRALLGEGVLRPPRARAPL